MKAKVLNSWMNIIKDNKDFDDVKLAEIKYGLEGLYLTVSKLVIIGVLAALLGIFKEMMIFIAIYTVMRCPSFGIHASKSWICLLSSAIIFIGLPLVSINIQISLFSKIIFGMISIFGICLFSPADTKKKPIVNKTRRMVYKLLSTVIAGTYIALSIIVKDNFVANCFIYSTFLQNIIISPITYKLFNVPYNNYKTYISKHGLN